MKLPEPTILDPASVPSLRFGVMGPGDIAGTFVSSVHTHTTQKIEAVASRTPGKAEAFAATHGIPQVFTSYEELVASPDVDALYIASYPVDHAEHALLAIEAGKPVLIEKPLAMTAADTQKVFAAGRARGVLVMEAMWTRYLPQSTMIRSLLEEGSLGAPELFTSQFCTDNRAIERLWAPGGGGIVFDMGIYSLAMAYQFLGSPSTIRAHGSMHPGGSDQEASIMLGYESGASAHLIMSGRGSLPPTAGCSFENGQLVVDAPFLVPSGLSLMDKEFYAAGEHWRDTSDVQGHAGLSYQATWFSQFVEQGLRDSPVHTHEETVDIIRTLEEIVRQVRVSSES